MSTMLIVGAGKAGTAIARAALAKGRSVRMLEIRPDHVDELVAGLSAASVHLGSGTDPHDLEAAGIRGCDLLVAATGSDEVNLVSSTIAKFEFEIATVIARVVDPRNRWLFEPDMGVDVALDETRLMAEMVAEQDQR